MRRQARPLSPTRQARRLRQESTDAEKALWQLLRRHQLAGYKFRRQVPAGRYIVDFMCLNPKLVIELDGGQHQAQSAADAARTRWLEQRGFRVIRFWNNQALEETEAVTEAILNALQALEGP